MEETLTPDYTKYTLEQLEYELRHLNEELYPDRFHRLLQEIDNRKNPAGDEDGPPKRSLSRFFRYHPPEYEALEGQTGRWKPRT